MIQSMSNRLALLARWSVCQNLNRVSLVEFSSVQLRPSVRALSVVELGRPQRSYGTLLSPFCLLTPVKLSYHLSIFTDDVMLRVRVYLFARYRPTQKVIDGFWWISEWHIRRAEVDFGRNSDYILDLNRTLDSDPDTEIQKSWR